MAHLFDAGVVKLVDAQDSKSCIRKGVTVRVRPPALAFRERELADDVQYPSIWFGLSPFYQTRSLKERTAGNAILLCDLETQGTPPISSGQATKKMSSVCTAQFPLFYQQTLPPPSLAWYHPLKQGLYEKLL